MQWQLVKSRLFVCLFLLPAFVIAEIPPAQVPEPPPSTEPMISLPLQPAAQPQGDDRKKGASSAEKMAQVAAAIAAAMCAMMMAQAAQMPPGPEKTQMMAQAAQQCAQAAANQKNAGDNEKAKNAVANNNTPTGQQQQAKTPKNSSPLQIPQMGGTDSGESTEFPETASLPEPSLTDPSDLPEPTDFNSGDFDFGSGGAFAGVSTPKSVESSEVSFNENNKGDEQRLNPPGSANLGAFGGFGTLGEPNAKAKDSEGKERGNREKGEGEHGEGFSTMDGQSASGAGEGGGAGGPIAFDKMLSDIMGGKQEPIPVLGSQSGIVVLRNVGDRKMTIFELAKTRYRRAGYNEGLVDVRKPNRYREPASVPKNP